MIERQDFKKNVQPILDWIDFYFQNIENLPVKSQVKPKEIYDKIPTTAPKTAEEWQVILNDLTDTILPGITHWQHPNYHAYFTANSSIESLYGEFITSAIAAQCMIWETSPAAAELEERMMDWFKDLMNIPREWEGTIQDTASTSTLVAILTAREWKTDFKSNEYGVPNNLRVYCSTQTHSSIEKGVKIAGMGSRNVVKIDVDEHFAMRVDLLEKAIEEDLANDKIPTCVVVALGTTGTVAMDPLKEVAALCQRHQIWLHIDAAFVGSAFILPEYHHFLEGIELSDSFTFNPHKWLFTNFDCSIYMVKNADLLINTFEILPEYLKTKTRGQVNDYRDWGIQLGRRFRALKLWFVFRGMGVEAMQEKLRFHIQLNTTFADFIQNSKDFELILPPFLCFSCFRFKPKNESNLDSLNKLNEEFLQMLNQRGKVFLSHTKINGQYVLRMVIAQTYVEEKHLEIAINELREVAQLIANKS